MAIQPNEINNNNQGAVDAKDALSIFKERKIKVLEAFEGNAREKINGILSMLKELAKENYLKVFEGIHAELKTLQKQLNDIKIADEIGPKIRDEFFQDVSILYRSCFYEVLKSRYHDNDFKEVSKCFLEMVAVEEDILIKSQLVNQANEALFAEWKKILDKKVETHLFKMESLLGSGAFLDMVVEVRDFLAAAGDNDFVNKYSSVKKDQFILPYLRQAVRKWVEVLPGFPKENCPSLLKACNEVVEILEIRKARSIQKQDGISDSIGLLIWKVKLVKAEILDSASSSSSDKIMHKWAPNFNKVVNKISEKTSDLNLGLKVSIPKLKVSIPELKAQIKENLENPNSTNVDLEGIKLDYGNLMKKLHDRGNTHELIKEYFPEHVPKDQDIPVPPPGM